MTVKEFAVKYDVPYRMVFDASYSLPYTMRNDKEKDYKPEDLKDAVYRRAYTLVHKYNDKASVYGQIVMNLLTRI